MMQVFLISTIKHPPERRIKLFIYFNYICYYFSACPLDIRNRMTHYVHVTSQNEPFPFKLFKFQIFLISLLLIVVL